MEWNFHIDNRPWELSRALYIQGLDRHTGKAFLVAPFTLTDLESNRSVPLDSPTIRDEGMAFLMDNRVTNIGAFLQSALNAAWKEGLRPTDYKAPADTAPEIAALRYHLEDMRTLAKLRDRQT